MLKEEFFRKISPDVREYLNDKEVGLEELAVLADKFACMKGMAAKKPFNQRYSDSKFENVKVSDGCDQRHDHVGSSPVQFSKQNWKENDSKMNVNGNGVKETCTSCPQNTLRCKKYNKLEAPTLFGSEQ